LGVILILILSSLHWRVESGVSYNVTIQFQHFNFKGKKRKKIIGRNGMEWNGVICQTDADYSLQSLSLYPE
jgi:hypothetical protein